VTLSLKRHLLSNKILIHDTITAPSLSERTQKRRQREVSQSVSAGQVSKWGGNKMWIRWVQIAAGREREREEGRDMALDQPDLGDIFEMREIPDLVHDLDGDVVVKGHESDSSWVRESEWWIVVKGLLRSDHVEIGDVDIASMQQIQNLEDRPWLVFVLEGEDIAALRLESKVRICLIDSHWGEWERQRGERRREKERDRERVRERQRGWVRETHQHVGQSQRRIQWWCWWTHSPIAQSQSQG
jgi:hypothetical protein